ncbi:superoxide dismutase [Parafrankia sp. BMG5.11]|nr:superoxide dismutase [Parafrankia sp. BMG5.11]
MQNRRAVLTALAGTAAALTTSAAGASLAAAAPDGPGDAKGPGRFPDTIALPTGFFPEGIVIGNGPHAYITSLANGDVYKLNLATGAGQVLTPGPGTGAVGITLDAFGRMFVAGGSAGTMWVIDSATGQMIARYQLATEASFVNDVVLTRDAAWVTDSLAPVLYKLPFDRLGTLPSQADVVRIPLGGDIIFRDGFNANGIVRTPDNKALLIVQTNTGKLFRVDPATGLATEVDLGYDDLTFGDGMLLEGRTLYVVQNMTNTVAVVQLDTTGSVGRITERRTDPRFDTPTTIARFSNRFYLPNARFNNPSPQTAEFTVVAIPR